MNHPYVNQELARLRYAELLREADQYRLAKQVSGSSEDPSRFVRLRGSLNGLLAARALRRESRAVRPV